MPDSHVMDSPRAIPKKSGWTGCTSDFPTAVVAPELAGDVPLISYTPIVVSLSEAKDLLFVSALRKLSTGHRVSFPHILHTSCERLLCQSFL